MSAEPEVPQEFTTRERVERVLLDAMYPPRPPRPLARRRMVLNLLGWLVLLLIPILFIELTQ